MSIKGYWRLDGNSNDASGNGNNLTNVGSVLFVPSKLNYGANLGASNTTNTFVITTNCGIDGSAITMNILIKMQSEISAGVWSIAKISTGSPYYRNFHINYDYNAGNRRFVFGMNRDGAATYDSYKVFTAGTSNFYMLGLTYDGTTIKGFINGVQVSNIAASGNGSSSYSANFTIGTWREGVTYYNFSSIVADEVILDNSAYSASEMKNKYASYTGFF